MNLPVRFTAFNEQTGQVEARILPLEEFIEFMKTYSGRTLSASTTLVSKGNGYTS